MIKVLLFCVLSIFSFQSWAEADNLGDLNITVLNYSSQFTVNINSRYIATEDTHACTEIVRDGWSYKRVKINVIGVPAQLSANSFTAPMYLPGEELNESSECEFAKVDSSFAVTTARADTSYNVVEVFDNGEGSGVQTVECHEQDFDSHGVMVVCYGDIYLDNKHQAIVEVVFD